MVRKILLKMIEEPDSESICIVRLSIRVFIITAKKYPMRLSTEHKLFLVSKILKLSCYVGTEKESKMQKSPRRNRAL